MRRRPLGLLRECVKDQHAVLSSREVETRETPSSPLTRSSETPGATSGIDRATGMPSLSPSCSRNNPLPMLARTSFGKRRISSLAFGWKMIGRTALRVSNLRHARLVGVHVNVKRAERHSAADRRSSQSRAGVPPAVLNSGLLLIADRTVLARRSPTRRERRGSQADREPGR